MVMPHVNGRASSNRIVTDCYVKKALTLIKRGREADAARTDFLSFRRKTTSAHAHAPHSFNRALMINDEARTKDRPKLNQQRFWTLELVWSGLNFLNRTQLYTLWTHRGYYKQRGYSRWVLFGFRIHRWRTNREVANVEIITDLAAQCEVIT